jgi:hypothetical protein
MKRGMLGHLKLIGLAAVAGVVMLSLLSSVVVAAPGGDRPGWGCGDDNHVHTGPKGRGSSNSPCEGNQGNEGNHGNQDDEDDQGHERHGGAVRLEITVPASASAGNAFNFTVAAVDRDGHTLTSFGDTLHFTSSDSQAVLPADSTLTNSTATFSATLKTAGNQTITATDTSNSSVRARSGRVSVSAVAATHLAVSAPASVSNGAAFTFTVTAQDQFNNTTTGFGDVVHFTSSDGSATLPADTTLTNGTGTFTATLRTNGNQTITATDTSNGSITGSSAAISVS